MKGKILIICIALLVAVYGCSSEQSSAEKMSGYGIDNQKKVRKVIEQEQRMAILKENEPIMDNVILDDSDVLGKRDFEELIDSLKEPNSIVRIEAAVTLGKVIDESAVEPLIAALSDGNLEVRREAARALKVYKDSRTVEPLIAALKDEAFEVQLAAANTLGAIGGLSLEYLRAALKDESLHVRKGAVRALSKMNDQ